MLLLGRFFMFAPLAEWLIRGEYIRYRYLTEVPRGERGTSMASWRWRWRVMIGHKRSLMGDSLNDLIIGC